MNRIYRLAFAIAIILLAFVANAGSYWNSPVPIKKVAKKDQICFVLYTVHQKTLKMTVHFYPLEAKDSRKVFLEVMDGGKWKRVAEGKIRENEYGLRDAKAWNLLFRVEKWDESKDWQYRVVALDGVAVYPGTIKRDPIDKDEIVVAAFTGNSAKDQGSRADIVEAVDSQKPDLLFFSGDQVYHHSHHMAEWLVFGEYFGELTRKYPTICIPDDHDVGQGNLWGAGGKKSKTRFCCDGGYIRSAQYVREVQFAQTANLPDPYDPTPIKQGIGVYYTSLNVGGIDFAIIEDRKFKNGPLEIFPNLKGRPDHATGMKPEDLDNPKAILLGKRQLKFLDAWGQNWKGAQMKCVLSQTIFCQGHTTQKIDLDTNGWPRSERNRALRTIRKCFAFMLAGDQHLSTFIHHGVDEFGDSGYSFAVPSIANHYPRLWKPKKKPVRKIESPLPYTGDYLDALGNKITMLAYTQPKPSTGHGIVRFNKKTRTIIVENWPRHTGKNGRQYPGWPKTIKQEDNYARKAMAYLPTITVKGMADPVIQVIEEKTNTVVYTLRIKGVTWRPKIFAPGSYTVVVGNQADKVKTFKNLTPSDTKMTVEF